MTKENALDIIERAKMDLIHLYSDGEGEIPKKYLKKLDTILGKLENLEWDIANWKK